MKVKNITLKDVRGDFRKLLYLEAKRISVVRSLDAASDFLGLGDGTFEWSPLEAESNEELELVRKIDVSEFDIMQTIEIAYEAIVNKNSEFLLTNIEAMDLDYFLSTLPILDDDKLQTKWVKECSCVWVARAGSAMAKIQASIYGAMGAAAGNFDTFYVLRVRDLAALANMSEATVRNAISSKGSDRLEKLESDDNVVWIDVVEATRWLSERRGYQPRPGDVASDGYFPDYVAWNAASALRWLGLRMYWMAGSAAHVAALLGATEDTVIGFLNGNCALESEEQIRAFAEIVFVKPDDMVNGLRQLSATKS